MQVPVKLVPPVRSDATAGKAFGSVGVVAEIDKVALASGAGLRWLGVVPGEWISTLSLPVVMVPSSMSEETAAA
ncbi:hypothetical protein GCM10007890_52470 [Methylobacterium tardum]|uniref:Uncharacterized protein n=1 Tax=Methylobacterium tardum TaxID=374432 RepID=A0AA37TPR0_9HYPH|nr:hypothetical protein GCM10007890_52470 [Methylobacterium tardum]